jgi:hypothetical protein
MQKLFSGTFKKPASSDPLSAWVSGSWDLPDYMTSECRSPREQGSILRSSIFGQNIFKKLNAPATPSPPKEAAIIYSFNCTQSLCTMC